MDDALLERVVAELRRRGYPGSDVELCRLAETWPGRALERLVDEGSRALALAAARLSHFSMKQGDLLITMVPGAAKAYCGAVEWRVRRLDGGAVRATDLRSARVNDVYQARAHWLRYGVLPVDCSAENHT